MKPEFFIVGAAKCGTTSLKNALMRHPGVFMAANENHFFSFDERYARGVDWYESHFAEAGDCGVRGEKCTSYAMRTAYPHAVPRLAEYRPDAKLIYIVRHPLQKIESIWLEFRSWTHAKSVPYLENSMLNDGEVMHHSFDKAIRAHEDFLVKPANYWQEISRYREFFPDQQILVLFLDDLKVDSERELAKCFDFLGVGPLPPGIAAPAHKNRSLDKRVPRKTLSRIRSLPGYRALKGLVPKSVRRVFNPILKTRPTRPQWEDATRSRVIDDLREDTARFLEFYDRPKDFWTLDA